jgi:GPH family glycoside/pentoside/hexuronide:cation symporter
VGEFRPYILWMAIPVAITFVLTFTTPDSRISGKIVYAYFTDSLMILIYSLINVPYASLIGVMSDDGKQRTTLATFRFIFAFGGSFLVLAIFQPLFNGFGTKTYAEFASPSVVEIADSSSQSTDRIMLWNGAGMNQLSAASRDSLLFITAKVNTKTKADFRLGVFDFRSLIETGATKNQSELAAFDSVSRTWIS